MGDHSTAMSTSKQIISNNNKKPPLVEDDFRNRRHLIQLILKGNCSNIKSFLHNFDNDMKCHLLETSYQYCNVIHATISEEMHNSIRWEFLKINFNGPKTNTQITTTNISKTRLLYLIKCMDAVIEWKKPTSVLLYHIRQIILIANQCRYDKGMIKKLSWFKFIFYLLQYVKCCTSNDSLHLFLLSFYSKNKVVKLLEVYKSALSVKTKQELIGLLESKKEIINELDEDYGIIRNIYVLNRIVTSLKMCIPTHGVYTCYDSVSMYAKLRIIQIIGECLKDTPGSPNITGDLINMINAVIDEQHVDKFIDLRHKLSHLTTIDLWLEEYWHFNIIQSLDRDFATIQYNYLESKTTIFKKRNTCPLEFLSLYKKTKYTLFNKCMPIYLIKHPGYRVNSWINGISKEMFKIHYDFQNNILTKDYCKSLKHSLYYENHLDLEMKLLITLNYLHETKRQLNTNRKWYMAKYPTLTGLQLRHHLAHGDPIVSTLDIDEKMAVRDTALLLIEEWEHIEKDDLHIEKDTNQSIVDLQNDSKKCLDMLEEMEAFMQNVTSGQLRDIQLDIEKHVNEWMHWRTPEKQTALHIACQNKDQKVFQLIAKEAPELIKKKDVYGNTILHLATIYNNFSIVKQILNTQECEVVISEDFISNMDNETPIHLASFLGHVELIKLFIKLPIIKYVCNEDIVRLSAINYATYGNHISVVKLLAKYDYESLYSSLIIACQLGAINMLEHLIKIGTDINIDAVSVQVIDKLGHQGIIDLLIAHGAYRLQNKPYLQDESAKLFKLIEENNTKSLSIFLRNKEMLLGVSNPLDGKNSMHYAIISGNKQIVKEIYERMPHLLFIQDRLNKTPIGMSAELENDAMLEYIVELIIDNLQERPCFLQPLCLQFNSVKLNEKKTTFILHRGLHLIDTSTHDECFYECGLTLIRNVLHNIKHIWCEKLLMDVIIRALSNFTENKDISKIWIEIIVDILATVNNPPQIIWDKVKNSNCSTITELFRQISISAKNWENTRQLCALIMESTTKYANDKHLQMFAMKIITLNNLPIEREILEKLLISNLNRFPLNTHITEMIPTFLRIISEISNPNQRLVLMDAILKLIIRWTNNDDLLLYSFIIFIDLYDHEWETIIKNLIIEIHNSVEIKEVQFSSLTIILLIDMYKYNLTNSFIQTLLVIALNNIHSFCMCKHKMWVCLILIVNLMDIMERKGIPCDINGIFDSLLNVPNIYLAIRHGRGNCFFRQSQSGIWLKFVLKFVDKNHNDKFIEIGAMYEIYKNCLREIKPGCKLIQTVAVIALSNMHTFDMVLSYNQKIIINILNNKVSLYLDDTFYTILRKELFKLVLDAPGQNNEVLIQCANALNVLFKNEIETLITYTCSQNYLDNRTLQTNSMHLFLDCIEKYRYQPNNDDGVLLYDIDEMFDSIMSIPEKCSNFIRSIKEPTLLTSHQKSTWLFFALRVMDKYYNNNCVNDEAMVVIHSCLSPEYKAGYKLIQTLAAIMINILQSNSKSSVVLWKLLMDKLLDIKSPYLSDEFYTILSKSRSKISLLERKQTNATPPETRVKRRQSLEFLVLNYC